VVELMWKDYTCFPIDKNVTHKLHKINNSSHSKIVEYKRLQKLEASLPMHPGRVHGNVR